MDGCDKFTSWFFTEILGIWFIWSTYMAIRFIADDGQGFKASFGSHDSSGAFILIPIFASVIFSLGSAAFWSAQD